MVLDPWVLVHWFIGSWFWLWVLEFWVKVSGNGSWFFGEWWWYWYWYWYQYRCWVPVIIGLVLDPQYGFWVILFIWIVLGVLYRSFSVFGLFSYSFLPLSASFVYRPFCLSPWVHLFHSMVSWSVLFVFWLCFLVIIWFYLRSFCAVKLPSVACW